MCVCYARKVSGKLVLRQLSLCFQPVQETDLLGRRKFRGSLRRLEVWFPDFGDSFGGGILVGEPGLTRNSQSLERSEARPIQGRTICWFKAYRLAGGGEDRARGSPKKM